MIAYRTSHQAAAAVCTVISTIFCAAIVGLAASGDTSDSRTVKVAGSGVDGLNAAVIHSQEPTANGKVQHSTEIVELTGDLKGKVLYQVTSVYDFVHGTLVNTGDEVFSGTVGGSAPVMIHDDQFRFEVNLTTGADAGKVYLFDRIAGPKVRCTLDVVGTGLNADGNPTFTYTGECTFRGR